MKHVFTSIVALFIAFSAQAQYGHIDGTILDPETLEPIPFATVVVMEDGKLVAGANTDMDGRFVLKPLDPGCYTVSIHYAGFKKDIPEVNVTADKITFMRNIHLSARDEPCICPPVEPLRVIPPHNKIVIKGDELDNYVW